jgi:hypothetical protein|tara:strand:+ start:736 stop:1245 length:510 start_codon:yes stop_codon:yes gene_type:complete
MTNFLPISKKEIFPIGVILVLALSRLIPHPPNFTPLIAAAIMSSFFFRNIYLSLLVLFISLLVADAVIGFYQNMIFVYLSLFLVAFVSFKITENITYKNLIFISFLGSFIFYLFSNFGVWLFGILYEKNINGLINCYILALPFFKNTLLSTIMFSYIGFLFGKIYYKTA